MAFCDKKFHDSESKIINQWINERVEKVAKNKRLEVKKSYNTVLRDTKKIIKTDESYIHKHLPGLCSQLRSLKSEPSEIAALDLVIEIMTADNEVHPNEVKLMHQIAGLLEISQKEIMNKTNREILLMGKVPEDIAIEDLLNINPTVSNKNADKRFQKEIKKWNGATASVDTELGRKIAQKMYDLFSEANDKYA